MRKIVIIIIVLIAMKYLVSGSSAENPGDKYLSLQPLLQLMLLRYIVLTTIFVRRLKRQTEPAGCFGVNERFAVLCFVLHLLLREWMVGGAIQTITDILFVIAVISIGLKQYMVKRHNENDKLSMDS